MGEPVPSTPSESKVLDWQSANNGKREVRILMLHGFTQSGPLFRAKTRALEKALVKSLAPFDLIPQLTYPTAPTRLSPGDIPGWEPSSDHPTQTENFAWWRRHDGTRPEYAHLSTAMSHIAATIAGLPAPLDGIIGFSQGGAAAAMLASALEPDRAIPPAFEWARRLRAANNHKPLKFAVIYSGFWGNPDALQWLYHDPAIRTPTMHILGSLDTVVDEGRSRALVERCVEPVVVSHAGGHYVPVTKECTMRVVGFVKMCMEKRKGGEIQKEGGKGEGADDL